MTRPDSSSPSLSSPSSSASSSSSSPSPSSSTVARPALLWGVRLALVFALGLFALAACGASGALSGEPKPLPPIAEAVAAGGTAPSATEGEYEVALLAGGCFWCVESEYDDLPGVISAVSGYAQGAELKPTYKQVSSHATGHTEVVRVVYDPKKVDYAKIIEIFWHNIDPFQANGQFCDRGSQYRSGIYFMDDAQKAIAESTRDAHQATFDKPIVTEIVAAHAFWPAEDYHQDFHVTNASHYQRYRAGCGRDRRLKEIWGKSAGH